MPWEEKSIMEQRIEFVAQVIQKTQTFTEICRQMNISRPTGYLWLKRFQETESYLGLVEHSRRPHHIPHQTSPDLEKKVLKLHKAYGWGPRKVSEILSNQGITLPAITIYRIFKRNNLIIHKNTHPEARIRFERKYPNALWQMDFKGEFTGNYGVCYPLSILDDHSRYLIGLYPLKNMHLTLVKSCLQHSFEQYGLPEEMLMDHGTPWWSTTNGYGLTQLSIWLIKQGIHLIYSGICHPQTQGKVERFHRTLKAAIFHAGKPCSFVEWSPLLDKIRREYNEIRPHEALNMKTPATHYTSSPRPYLPNPPKWVYPANEKMAKLNSAGCLDYQRHRYFVCEALANEWVCLKPLNDLVLVQYRDTYIREINLKSKRTKPMVIKTYAFKSVKDVLI
jgi:transposase InsO family protein